METLSRNVCVGRERNAALQSQPHAAGRLFPGQNDVIRGAPWRLFTRSPSSMLPQFQPPARFILYGLTHKFRVSYFTNDTKKYVPAPCPHSFSSSHLVWWDPLSLYGTLQLPEFPTCFHFERGKIGGVPLFGPSYNYVASGEG